MNICLSCEGVTATAAQRCGHCGAFLLPLDSVHYPTRRGEADAGNPLLGSVVDSKYRLQGVLGRGGLGTVFQAEHVGSLMKVAVKLLHPRFSERPEYRRALLPEARRAATVTNERCARLLDVGETADGGTYLAMELVDGDTLDTLIRGGALAPAHAVDVLVQVAEALVAIHAGGLVHCDLSPRNVMVATRGGALVAKVLDFGIARSVSMTAGERPDDGEFSGFANLAFSAPEQLAGREVDTRADLYSLGALAWFMLTGKPPIDDSDKARAARAAVAGELESWPGVAGVPRRLQRLITRCLALDPEDRPSSAAAVRRELLVIRGARRPALARAAITALAIAVVLAVAAFFETSEPFLRAVGGSPLTLGESPPAVALHLNSQRLATLQLRFGGFRADQLRLDVARGGTVLLNKELRPVVDEAGSTLTLAVAQPEWQSAVQSLVDSSREAAVEVSFVVPGRAPLGSTRIRLDDEPPSVQAEIVEPEVEVLTSATALRWQATDAIELYEVVVEVEFEDGSRRAWTLDGGAGVFALGQQLAATVEDVGSRLGGAVRLRAKDRAGNVRAVEVAKFGRCDVRAPEVLAVTGPPGEAFVTSVAGVVRMRVQLSAPEPGCELVVTDLDGNEFARRKLDAGQFHDVEIPGTETAFESGIYDFAVVDPVGNRSERRFDCTVRDRDVRMQLFGEAPDSINVGRELVIGPRGGRATLSCSDAWEVARLTVSSGLAGAVPSTVEFTVEPGRSALRFGALPAGRHRLEVELAARGSPAAPPAREIVPLRVLPESIELRVTLPATRFLSGLVQAGVLQRGDGDSYREGPGWAIDPEHAPYVRGSLWTGIVGETLLPKTLPTAPPSAGALLPEFQPRRGHNLLAVSLHDVLERRVRILVGDAAPPRAEIRGRTVDVVAEFYWHDLPPEPIGEELLVEYGQTTRLRLRFPLPYLSTERQMLRLSLAQSEIVASAVEREGDGASIATFELPFSDWRRAANLVDQPREAFADQLERVAKVTVQTPVGAHELSLSVRTTRSTLRPVRLGELGDVPAALAALRLVPVLAPNGPFPEPVPADAPPRSLFRPQVAVAVRNIRDFLLQDRELSCAEAEAIVTAGLQRIGDLDPGTLVHADDPLGERRLTRENLLPSHVAAAAADEPLTGVDFFQAYASCRLLGVVLAGDPALFRLPMGCELELAAFAGAVAAACNGPAAAGQPVSMRAFETAAERLARGRVATASETRQAGDHVTGAMQVEIGGLDFGVREWVGDLPHIPDNELLMSEWIADHEGHLARVAAFASGAAAPPADLRSPLRTYAVVRGLALGELEGLLQSSGQRLDPRTTDVVPASVPGVLRTEQLRRDGRDLLSTRTDPRLRRIGFRVAGTEELVLRMRGRE